MTSTQILETLAREFSIDADKARNALELIDAGLSPAFIGRCRRAETGELSETMLRRVGRRREELAELDRRRATILRMFDAAEAAAGRSDPVARARIETCVDRFELEDLFIPHRRPEPEVQLALDRGLGELADLLVAPVRPPRRGEDEGAAEDGQDELGDGDETQAGTRAREPLAPGGDSTPRGVSGDESERALDVDPARAAGAVGTLEPDAADAADADGTQAAAAEQEIHSAAEQAAFEQAGEGASVADAPDDSPDGPPDGPSGASQEPSVRLAGAEPGPAGLSAFALTPELARACAPFVRPDRGIHTESEALSGALRILSDRLGRNARLRGTVRRALRKNGVLTVRATVDEGRLGRHRSLLKTKQPLRQLQGHRLLAIRQAQKERAVAAFVEIEPSLVLPKVRAVLGKHTAPEFDLVLDDIARQALEQRLLPMVEADVRLELKERADEEALRFLSQHLRQVLLAPPAGERAVLGVDVSAKGDWTLAPLDPHGQLAQSCVRIEVGDKEPAALGAELVAALEPQQIRGIAVGHGKGPRAAAPKLRRALAAVGSDVGVLLVNEAGLSSYANSELARRELGEHAVPERMAISLGRRLQDSLAEIVKVDPRHLGLGSEQGLVSKANVRRMFEETIESCVAHVGCDVNRASVELLRHVPGLDLEAAKRLVAQRAERPFESREELATEGLLSEAQWTSAIAFLRIPEAPNVLDRTGLHPSQYDLARRIVESTGGTLEEQIGRPGLTKGMRRADFDVDEFTWRDLMREISYPGRDPRPRVWLPLLLHPDTDRATLTPGRVLEGIISNVASFGAFVDIGLEHDGMIHISEVSERYVRDARELLSIGQVVRMRLLDASGQRVALSLKNVPREVEQRPAAGARRERGPERGGERRAERGERGAGRGRPSPQPNLRAAQERRDGLMPGRTKQDQRGGRGGGAGRHGTGGGDRGRGRRDDVAVRPEDLRTVNRGVAAYNPFASFFKKDSEVESSASAPAASTDAPSAE